MNAKYKYVFDAIIHLPKLAFLVDEPNSFSGRTARSDRAVMRALVQIADQHGAYSIRPGVRKISEFCGHDPRTVCSSLRRLSKKDWISILWASKPLMGMPSRIRLNWERAAEVSLEDSASDCKFLWDITIWTGDCLGSNARAVYKALLLAGAPLKKLQIQKSTSLGYKAVSTALRVLLGENLVVKDNRQYKIREFSADEQNALLNKIREKWAVDKKIKSRLDRHFYQREAYKFAEKYSDNFKMLRAREFDFARKSKV